MNASEDDNDIDLPVFKTLDSSTVQSVSISQRICPDLEITPQKITESKGDTDEGVIGDTDEGEIDDLDDTYENLLSIPIRIEDVKKAVLDLHSIEHHASVVTDMVCGDVQSIRDQIALRSEIATVVRQTKAKLLSETITALYTLRYLQHSVDSIHLLPVSYRKKYTPTQVPYATFLKKTLLVVIGIGIGILMK